MSVQIFACGGTFDKEYDQISQKLVFRDSHVKETLEEGKCRIPIEVRTLMMIDSLDMTPDHRASIAEQCVASPAESIVITHGTDTMVDTAHVIAAHVQDKTVVLTGAMVPYTFGSSDGLFNLGCAIAFAQSLEPGVYIAMNGRYFDHRNVKKNLTTGNFEENI